MANLRESIDLVDLNSCHLRSDLPVKIQLLGLSKKTCYENLNRGTELRISG